MICLSWIIVFKNLLFDSTNCNWRAISLHAKCGRKCPASLNITQVNFDQTFASKCYASKVMRVNAVLTLLRELE